MINLLVNILVAALLGSIALTVTSLFVASVDTTGWGSESVPMGLLPGAVGIVVVLGMFVLLTKMRRSTE
jgi:cadmium resistance protein CadD (predicted permease)